jgi:hypothetical protein
MFPPKGCWPVLREYAGRSMPTWREVVPEPHSAAVVWI